MNNKLIIFSAFVVVAIAQLFVPAQMILQRESVLEEGKIYKFKTAPIDPTDPFRGKYVRLSFSNQQIAKVGGKWEAGETVFALLELDSAGFSIIGDIQRDQPSEEIDYLKVEIDYVKDNSWQDSTNIVSTIRLNFPFDRFYMEESKAYEAELAYNDARWEQKTAYALVSIKEGEAVLKDVLIDGIPIREIAKERNEKKALEK
ncbi:MAG: putative membrane-anchored protein [Arenicella sp.]|jgi:uncharacterized membrane-anchored protein